MDLIEEPSTPPTPKTSGRPRRDIVVERLQKRVEELEAVVVEKEKTILSLQERCFNMRQQLKNGCVGNTIKSPIETRKWKARPPSQNTNHSGNDKRQLFYILRTVQNISPNTFFPVYGLTAGEFAVWQILTEYTKKSQ